MELASRRPKVDLSTVTAWRTVPSFRQVGKATESKLTPLFLIERNNVPAGRALTPMAQHIDAGRFEVKTGTSQASNHAFSGSFTAKGVRWIGGLWTEYKPEVQRESLLTPEIATVWVGSFGLVN
jgi:phage antirepressor YoqD-like protein